jgi:hypothetical protein
MNFESRQAHRALDSKIQLAIAKLTDMRREINKILAKEEPPISTDQLQYLSSQAKVIQLTVDKCMEVFDEE